MTQTPKDLQFTEAVVIQVIVCFKQVAFMILDLF
jgi:hypothetical protein